MKDLFEMSNTKSIVKEKIIPESGKIPYVTASAENNGVMTYINCPDEWIDKGNCIMIGGKTLTFTFQEKDFCSNDSHNIALYAKEKKSAKKLFYLFYMSALRVSMKNKYSWGNSISMKKIQEEKILLPTKNGEIDFEFMEKFITELEAEHIKEIEEKSIVELEAYLTAAGLKDFILTDEEKFALENLNSCIWQKFLLKDLFSESTRGKRLKSDDRIEGNLPFVTAGETDEGISAYIGNEVRIFSKNTITIDMFGSAKYRNYNYGADDHIAVVHTEKISKFAAIFITSAIHKSSHNGQFHYGRNFYAKDADSLEICLPTKDGEIDYKFMEKFITAVQKIIIADVVKYSEEKISAYRQAANK